MQEGGSADTAPAMRGVRLSTARQMELLDESNKLLDEMQTELQRIKKRSHLLQVDLATTFSPVMVEKLQNVEESCQKCEVCVDHVLANAKITISKTDPTTGNEVAG